MTVISSSVVALGLLRKYKCPHCGAEQQRVLPKIGASLECTNCLKPFSPPGAVVAKPKSHQRKR